MDNNLFTLKGHQQHHIFIQTNKILKKLMKKRKEFADFILSRESVKDLRVNVRRYF